MLFKCLIDHPIVQASRFAKSFCIHLFHNLQKMSDAGPPARGFRLPRSEVPLFTPYSMTPVPVSQPTPVPQQIIPEAPKRKWARVQATDLASSKYQRAEGQTEYNIWYNKYLGDQDHERHPATTRCDSKRDAGLTRADMTNPNAYICLYFAKGCCVNGKKCTFFHRVPTPEDDARIDLMHDVFGRQRHAKDRDDMGGVGSFNRENKTLYVTDIPINSVKQTEEIVRRHFGEWGPLDEVAVKPKIGCIFIRYKYRANAEFAKVAMAEQALDGDEQINVRWAHDDSNPKSLSNNQQAKESRVMQAVLKKGFSAANAKLPYDAPLDYKVSGDSSSYPDTNHQYIGQTALPSNADIEQTVRPSFVHPQIPQTSNTPVNEPTSLAAATPADQFAALLARIDSSVAK
jgi:hypothetical protein